MKKIFILIIITLVNISSFAQRTDRKYAVPVNSIDVGNGALLNNTAAKTSGLGDTLKLSNIAAADTPYVIYSAGVDSGYLTGTNYWGDKGFAERYDFSSADSTMQVIGVFTRFSGNVNPTSAKKVSLNIWSPGAAQYITSRMFYSGFPSSLIISDTVSVKQLGIGATIDTMKKFLFSQPTDFFHGSFFVGYNIDYNFNTLGGDTIGLASSMDGDRTSPKTYLDVVITDIDTVVNTMINVQNATQWSDGTWHDNYSDNDSISNDLAIFPIVIIGHPAGVQGVTRNNLTFFGSYPNPAVSVANVKFSLAKQTDVTIQIMDMNGRLLNTISQNNIAAGEHIIPVNMATLPPGEYLYLLRTSGGDGVASKLIISPKP